MSKDEPDVRPEDALQVAQRALSKVNDLERDLGYLREEYDDLTDDVTALELRLSEIDDERPYDGLTLNEKIGKVREHAFRRASDGHGKAALDYNDIMWSVFDGEPGAKHCYKLMRKAAEARGFEVGKQDGSKKLLVDAAEAKRGAAFFPENKTASEGVN
ncbi:hypothetical protein [Natrinema ejinorense]|uniref:Uncharacterized protein n=1 Tax=Natrinema ejinorense TaxID=373386 RepID=A0A2A5QR69_9EURY|nr:hypothetical protein [Natrinema ejinorense]PCR89294.1 hypothetical protein CP557_01325 [Natrinema ejinorense]